MNTNKSFAFLCALFLSLPLMAQIHNPQIRACLAAGGSFSVADIPGDQIGLCNIGSSVIGTVDLLKNADREISMSIDTYKNGGTVCPEGHEVILNAEFKTAFRACLFDDKSVIDMNSLQKGLYSPDNSKLNEALGL